MTKLQRFSELTTPAIALFVLFASFTSANAQQDAPDSGEESFFLEEVIVTAQRREQSILDVPVSITALSGEMIDRTQIFNLEDVSDYTPNLYFLESNNTKSNDIVIRGISTITQSSGGLDQPSAVYVDDVYQSTAIAQQFDLFDVERIEILRGPQGTLFGRNTLAGLIHVITRKPTEEFEGYVNGTAGNYGLIRVKGSFSGPLNGDSVLGKLSFMYNDRDGYETNVFTGNSVNDKQNWAVKGDLLIHASDTVDILLSANYREVDQGQRVLELSGFNTVSGPGLTFDNGPLGPLEGLVLPSGLTLNLADSSDTDLDRRVNVDNEGREQLEAYGASAIFDVDFGVTAFKSITAINSHEYNQFGEADYTDIDNSSAGNPEEVDVFSQEFRLSSQADDVFLDWVVGANYYHQTTDTEFFQTFADDADAIIQVIGLGFLSPLGGIFTNSTTKTDAYGIFAHGIMHVTERLDVVLGARYSYEKKDFVFEQTTVGGIGPLLGLPTLTADDTRTSESWDAFTPLLTLDFKVTENTNVYGTVSKGFKSGGFNDMLNSEIGGDAELLDQSYKQEEMLNYEAGVKTSMMDGRMMLAGSLFRMKWEDVQGTVSIPTDFLQPLRIQTTMGTIITKGMELETLAYLTENFMTRLTFGYVDAKWDSVSENGQLTGIEAGDGVAFQPEWTGSLGFNYRYSLGNSGEMFVGADYFYRGESDITSNEVTIDPALGIEIPGTAVQDAYGLINARLGYISSNNRWQVILWGKNLTDEDYIVDQDAGSLANDAFNSVLRQALGAPRTYGIDVRYNF